jgi:hypothetical protein
VTAVARVRLVVEMDNGESHSLVSDRPAPRGDNPAFVGQQFGTAAEDLRARMVGVLTLAYGRQHQPPADDTVEWGTRAPGVGVTKHREEKVARGMLDSTSPVLGPKEGREVVFRRVTRWEPAP